ncbi:MAG: hypothetical protein MUF15_20560 [Acidobacteria bacterium]|jgi:hypothetical protein|nr:hypothetical protein [Acidobacteriota bacterium]
MRHLKGNNVKKCFSLLREFVEESKAVDNKKSIAILALKELDRVIAGDDVTSDNTEMSCLGRPILERS